MGARSAGPDEHAEPASQRDSRPTPRGSRSPLGRIMSEDAHARPTGDAPEPLYDVNIPTPTHAERARTLVAQISTGTLCTLALEPEGYPYGSFVTVAFDNGNPIFSSADSPSTPRTWSGILARRCWWPREALQIRSPTAASPCSDRARASKGIAAARAAFFAAHPNSSYYADFRDFAFWKLHVDDVRYIGGYGRMSWISKADWRPPNRIPRSVGRRHDCSYERRPRRRHGALLQGLFKSDRDHLREHDGRRQYGFDMSAMTPKGPRPVRLAFGKPVSTPEEVRAALISMVKDAKSKLG